MINNVAESDLLFDRRGDHVVDRKGRDLLEIAYEEGFMVNSVAKRLGMTVRDLEIALDRTVGMKPKNFFRQYRAILAKRMIQEGVGLHEIAEGLGFRHYSHFATEMKLFFEIPPLRLQKMIQKRCNVVKSG